MTKNFTQLVEKNQQTVIPISATNPKQDKYKENHTSALLKFKEVTKNQN
jgi:hypothetical protein